MTKPYYGELVIALDNLVEAVEDYADEEGPSDPAIEAALLDAIALLDRVVSAPAGIRRGPGWAAALDRTAARTAAAFAAEWGEAIL